GPRPRRARTGVRRHRRDLERSRRWLLLLGTPAAPPRRATAARRRARGGRGVRARCRVRDRTGPPLRAAVLGERADRRAHRRRHPTPPARLRPSGMTVTAARPLDARAVQEAAALIASHIRRTPTEKSDALSNLAGREVYLKLENLQKTGAFKIRGALHALLRKDARDRANGVVTASAGN